MLHEELSHAVIGAFYSAYDNTRHGMLEGLYQRALVIELRMLGLTVETEVPMRVRYRSIPIGVYRLDLIVNDVILVECKASEKIVRPHETQLLNYLTASGIEVGLLFNFGPRASFKRLVRTTDKSRPIQLTMERRSSPRPNVDQLLSE